MKLALISDTHYGCDELEPEVLDKFFKRIAREKPDALIHAGDWASSCFREMSECVELLRSHYNGPVVSVMAANHDCWESEQELTFVEERLSLTRPLFKRYKIATTLERRNDKVLIVGFSGWYGTEPPSNDCYWIPHYEAKFGKLHPYMRGILGPEWVKAISTLEKERYSGWTKIVVTHFNITPFLGGDRYTRMAANGMSGDFTKFEDLRDAGVKVICYGHTHSYDDTVVDGVQMLNSGSDYGKPSCLFFEVKDGQLQVLNGTRICG